jgi:hypothetical protein
MTNLCVWALMADFLIPELPSLGVGGKRSLLHWEPYYMLFNVESQSSFFYLLLLLLLLEDAKRGPVLLEIPLC